MLQIGKEVESNRTENSIVKQEAKGAHLIDFIIIQADKKIWKMSAALLQGVVRLYPS